MNIPTIVVVAFERDLALQRLLTSLERALYPDAHVRLVISIDYSGLDAVSEIARNFEWKHGEKRIICQEKKLGLKQHVLTCGDLSYDYQEIILLEDDLVVAPGFYQFACAVQSRFSENRQVAGCSLYHYTTSESSLLPFNIVDEGFDNFFMKIPSSSGQLWSLRQWDEFRKWEATSLEITENDYVPANVIAWPESSWKKRFWKYLTDTNKFFVYPTSSYTTNVGDRGTHHQELTNSHQSALTLKTGNFVFADMEETVNVYDQFFELLPEKIIELSYLNTELEIDLNGSKPLGLISKKYLISSKKCLNPIRRFSLSMFPLPLNVMLPLEIPSGYGYLSLGETVDFEPDIDLGVIRFVAGTVSGHVRRVIGEDERKSIIKSDPFVIGTKWLNLLNRLPGFVSAPLKKTVLFRNRWQNTK